MDEAIEPSERRKYSRRVWTNKNKPNARANTDFGRKEILDKFYDSDSDTDCDDARQV